MTIDAILVQIDNEIERLEKARALLSSTDGKPAATTVSKTTAPKKRTMSAKARKAIAAAQKKRWAKAKGKVPF